MFKKKFLVRLLRTSDTTCYIEYSYHTIFPNWIKLQNWMSMMRSWGTVVLPYAEAKEFAQKFKTIEDVNKWNAEQEELKVKYPDPNYDKPVVEYVLGGE